MAQIMEMSVFLCRLTCVWLLFITGHERVSSAVVRNYHVEPSPGRTSYGPAADPARLVLIHWKECQCRHFGATTDPLGKSLFVFYSAISIL